jgi:hypothetical protein
MVKYTNRKTRKQKNYALVGGGGTSSHVAPLPVKEDYRKLNIPFGVITEQTLGDCIKELIEGSYKIYSDLISENIPITIVCGGQSPAYYCLAMLFFKIFNPSLVNIVVLPHSKGGQKSNNMINENKRYCERLKEKQIMLRKNVVIIDGVHTGVGILALQSALHYCYDGLNIRLFAINHASNVRKISVNKEYIFRCEPKFSDTFPRLVTSYHPSNFNNSSKFITTLTTKGNPIAKMIIDIAREYPRIRVEDTEWYKANNEVTPEIQAYREKMMAKEAAAAAAAAAATAAAATAAAAAEAKREYVRLNPLNPIIVQTSYGIIHECPVCHGQSGTLLKINHRFNCPYLHTQMPSLVL